jgi:formylglycine-generating enzyme required for sulfatase activity
MKKLALLIGVSEYGAGFQPLPSAVEDVDALYRVLVDSERGEFLAPNIKVLKNPDRQEMENEIYWLFHDREADDLLLLYFSGHGIKDERNKFYLGTRITEKNDRGSLVPTSAVAATSLHDRIESSLSERQVIVLDACYSGAIAKGMTVKDDGKVNVEEYLGGKGRAILTSSSAIDYAFGSEAGLSIYTRYLVEGIATGAADLDEDDWISVDELHGYVAKKLRKAAPAMTPEFYPVQDGYKILLAKSRRDDPKLKYEREFQKRVEAGQGKFSLFVRKILEGKQQEWGISPEVAQEIENRVLQPYREYQGKLTEYEQTLTEAVAMGYPFSESEQAELKEYQQQLKLRDEDIAEIDRRVKPLAEIVTSVNQPPIPPLKPPIQPVTPQSSVYNPSRNQQPKTPTTPVPNPDRRNVLKWLGFGGTGVIMAFAIPQIFKSSNTSTQIPAKSSPLNQLPPQIKNLLLLNFSTIEFASVKLNDKGTIVDRPKGTAQIYNEDLGNAISLTMVKIPAGEFLMGSPTTEAGRSEDERPQHKVKVPEFYLGQTLVTQAQWQRIMDNNPSHFTEDGKLLPVEQVSWLDAQKFCQELSKQTSRKYRLPTEAEWEYACRAGTTTPFHFGETITTDVANFNGNGIYGNAPKGKYLRKTTSVGFYKIVNNFGLYDMHGNLWEWCLDHWHKNYQGAPSDGSAWLSENDKASRLLRGGSWYYTPHKCRSASRSIGFPDKPIEDIGFRVVCEIPRTL